MPGLSGLSNQSCERRFLPRGTRVFGFFAIVSSAIVSIVIEPAARMLPTAPDVQGPRTAACQDLADAIVRHLILRWRCAQLPASPKRGRGHHVESIAERRPRQPDQFRHPR